MLRIPLLFLLLAGHTFACLWDSDTLAEEAKGRPDVVRIIVGWFDRYPPEYYQMRLDRVTRDIRSNPNDLALYDDAAVACDRLGRPGESIAWMAKKKAILDTLPEVEAKTHRYRYLANLGTFHVHRWVSQPQEKRDGDLTDLREGEKLIAQAIKENPDAHFGREIYQLLAIRWLLWDGVSPIKTPPETHLAHGKFHWIETPFAGLDELHIDGITGLIHLGAAWESTDAFRSLALVLDSAKMASIAELAYLREKELLQFGKHSLHPIPLIRQGIGPGFSRYLEDRKPIHAYFPIARAAAQHRNAGWMAYQEERFGKGMHPDTHPDFWNGWVEPAFPAAPGPTLQQRVEGFARGRPGLALLLILVAASLMVLSIYKDIRRAFQGTTPGTSASG